MTYIVIVSNDPDVRPVISVVRFSSYFCVASAVVVVYDWTLTFAQEFELIWRQRWSFMTVLYICVRYIGILFHFNCILWSLPVPVTDVGCKILYFIWIWTPVVVNGVLGVIVMTRIHVMYGRSNKMLIFLAALLLVSMIACGVLTVIGNQGYSGGEAVLSGYHICVYSLDTDAVVPNMEKITPTAMWEIPAFFLALWIVIKHVRELQQLRTGSTIGDYFTVLIRSHALYFLAFVVLTCFNLGSLSPNITGSSSLGAAVYSNVPNIAQGFQMCVLGPRLILSLREYHAELVARSDGGTHMTSIAFQAGGDALTGEDV